MCDMSDPQYQLGFVFAGGAAGFAERVVLLRQMSVAKVLDAALSASARPAKAAIYGAVDHRAR